jgi:cell division septation protein DedD
MPLTLGLVVATVLVAAFFWWRQISEEPDVVVRPPVSRPAPGESRAGAAAPSPTPPETGAALDRRDGEAPVTATGEGTRVAASDEGTPAEPSEAEASAPSEEPVVEEPAELKATPERVSPTAPIGTTAGPLYAVHVASVKSESGAKKERDAFTKAGYPTFTRSVEIPNKGTWMRIYVGPYGERDAAKNIAGQVRESGLTDYTQIHRLPESGLRGGTGQGDR